MAMFSSFHAYDDEGYYLATLSDYLAGHPLLSGYPEVYGPFFYEFFGGLFKLLGLAPDNDAGRLVTTAMWLIASVTSGLVAYRLSRSFWLGLGAQLLTFSLLSALSSEPMATYGIVSVLLLAIAGASTFERGRPRASAAAIGAMVAALCLIKINVGGLAAIAVVFAWTASHRRKWLLLPVAGAMTILPFVLMSSLLTESWVFDFAVVVALSGAAVGVTCVIRPPRSQPASGRWLAAGGAIVAIPCVAVALAGGTHVNELWNGLVAAPLQFAHVFIVPLGVNPGHVAVAVLSFAAALAISLRYRNLPLPVLSTGLVRAGAGFFMLLSILLMPNSIFMSALPLAWMATQAPEESGGDPAGGYSRLLLPSLAVLETLQAFPIAGTQASMAGLCLVPVGVIILGDGIRQLAAAGMARPAALKGVAWTAPSVLVVNMAVVLVLALTAGAGFMTGVPLGVRGAEQLRLPAQQAADLRRLVAAIDQDCSSFVTFPGMNSMYVWTAEDPPTSVRYGTWWLVLDSSEQESVVQRLANMPRLCVVKNSRVIDMWDSGRPVPRTPLVDFIDRSFGHAAAYGDYELLVRTSS